MNLFPKCMERGNCYHGIKKVKVKENHRPISCFQAATKLLELLACNQTTEYMEENGLLPKSQHGFRAQRSTMSALTNVQQKWAISSQTANQDLHCQSSHLNFYMPKSNKSFTQNKCMIYTCLLHVVVQNISH